MEAVVLQRVGFLEYFVLKRVRISIPRQHLKTQTLVNPPPLGLHIPAACPCRIFVKQSSVFCVGYSGDLFSFSGSSTSRDTTSKVFSVNSCAKETQPPTKEKNRRIRITAGGDDFTLDPTKVELGRDLIGIGSTSSVFKRSISPGYGFYHRSCV